MKYDYRKYDCYYLIKGAITIAILVTAIIYLVTLVPNDLPMYSKSYSNHMKEIGNLFVHVISPILVLVDYCFDAKGRFKVFYPFVWLFFPIAYVCFVYSGRGHFYNIGGSKKFAYFFLDYQEIGVNGVVSWILGIAIGIIILGYTLVFLDKKLAKKIANTDKYSRVWKLCYFLFLNEKIH